MSALTSASTDPNEVSISVAGVKWSGWETVSISRGIETVPATFSLGGTERYPGEANATTVAINATSPVIITIGGDIVTTGYVDRVERQITPEQHDVRVSGRSKLADLVDCSGFTERWNLQNLTLGDVAKVICEPFGIAVSLPNGDTDVIPNLSVIVTETGWEFLEECCRWMTKIIYDDVNGNLVLADAGTNTHASGVSEGVNVQEMRGTFNTSEAYTQISAIYQDTAILSDGGDATAIPNVNKTFAKNVNWANRADGQPRYRPLLIVSEKGLPDVVERRVQWEMARREGRAQAINVTVDSWRDSAGALWTPNWKIPVHLPSLKLSATTWLITQVEFNRDENGTRAELTLMPPDSMAPMPESPFEFDWALHDAQNSPTTGAQTSSTQG